MHVFFVSRSIIVGFKALALHSALYSFLGVFNGKKMLSIDKAECTVNGYYTISLF